MSVSQFAPYGDKPNEAQEKLRDFILAERDKGNIVFWALDALVTAPLEEFVKQPADGILYDLNRSEEVSLTFIADKKWVNDFAVALVIRKLAGQRVAPSEIGPTVATDTPRTDKFYDDVSDREHHDDGTDPNWHLPSKWSYEAILDLVDFARTLEREAAALREKCRLEWDLRIVAERQRDEAVAREREALATRYEKKSLHALAKLVRSGEGRNGG